MTLAEIKTLRAEDLNILSAVAKAGDDQAARDFVKLAVWRALDRNKSSTMQEKGEVYDFLTNVMTLKVQRNG